MIGITYKTTRLKGSYKKKKKKLETPTRSRSLLSISQKLMIGWTHGVTVSAEKEYRVSLSMVERGNAFSRWHPDTGQIGNTFNTA